MKKAAKVFLIIGMIYSFYLVFPVIVGVKTINRLKIAKSRDELIGWGIASIICVSIIGGIFVLSIPDREFNNRAIESAESITKTEEPVPLIENKTQDNGTDSLDYIGRIKELKELYDSGALTEQEFNELKAEQLER